MTIDIQILFQDDQASGEICNGCKKEIKGTKWVMMLQVGGPESAEPIAEYCTLCKLEWEKE